MRTTDVVRQILDLLDAIEDSNSVHSEIEIHQNDEPDSRFRQILAMLQNRDADGYPHSNTPNEVVADVDAVTTLAGGGVNGPKHPADIRGDSVRIYGGN